MSKPKKTLEDQALLAKWMQGVKPLEKNKIEPYHKHAHASLILDKSSFAQSRQIKENYTRQDPFPTAPEWVSEAMTKTYSHYHKTSDSFYRASVPHPLRKQMRTGFLPIAASLDLHHHTLAQAQVIVPGFIWDCHRKHFELIMIIHGKGKVLKHWLLSALPHLTIVLAFCEACPHHGASGALYVLLKTIFLEEKYT